MKASNSARWWMVLALAVPGAIGCGADRDAQAQPAALDSHAPVAAKVVNAQETKGATIITLNRGRADGVAVGWRGRLRVKGKSDDLAGGGFEIVKVTERTAIAKVALEMAAVISNDDAILEQP